MATRTTARENLRRRILEATLKLHSQKGIFGTSWQDIAHLADVSVATVYNHFPSLEELVPACGDLLMQRLRPPSPEDAARIIGKAKGPQVRLLRVARELFAFYERAGSLIDIDHRERELESVREWEAYQQETVAALVQEALSQERYPVPAVRTVTALFDYPTFHALRTRGVGLKATATTVVGLATCFLDRHPSGRSASAND